MSCNDKVTAFEQAFAFIELLLQTLSFKWLVQGVMVIIADPVVGGVRVLLLAHRRAKPNEWVLTW